MSEVQPAEDVVKFSGPPSPAQDALEIEPARRAASQPSGDAPQRASESISEPELLKVEPEPAHDPPTNGIGGEKPASQSQTKPDLSADKASPEHVPTAKPDVDKATPEPAPSAKPDDKASPEPAAKPDDKATPEPVAKPDDKATPEPAPAAKPDDKASPEPAPSAKPDDKASPEPAPSAKPDNKASPEPAPSAKPDDKATPEPAPAAKPDVDKASPERSPARDSPSPGERAAADSGQDDSGCDTEPEPLPAAPGAMAEPSGPAMDDVEQLARSVVTDTLTRAKQEANMQREMDNRQKDPDIDDDGWLDVVGNGQLKKKVVTPGSGDRDSRPKRSQLVTVRLSARLEDGRPAPGLPERLIFGLGDGEVITGLDMAVGLMQPGETAEVFMAPRFAYGEKGLDDVIPPDASLTFTVQLEQVQPEAKYEEMSAQERLTVGSQKRDRGNWWFKRDDFNHAIQCYRRALDFFDNESDEFTGLPDDVHVLFEERLKVHNNMAAAQMKLEAFDAALRSVQLVLNCQPNNVKALYRKGKILMSQNKVSEAVDALKEAMVHSPENRSVQAELNKVLSRERQLAEEQKSLYRKMLGLPPAEGKPVTATPAKSFPVKLVVCGVACALAAVAINRLKLF